MGGTIGIDSTPGCGSTFWFNLPVRSSDAADAAAAPPEIAGRRVLIADDLEMNRRVLVITADGAALPAVIVIVIMIMIVPVGFLAA